MRVLVIFVGLLACADPTPCRAEGRGTSVEAFVDVPGLSSERFVESLSRRTGLSFSLVATEVATSRRARLELSFDQGRSVARVAFHDGESDAAALVVLAQIAPSFSIDEEWFLLQAEAAIRNFSACEADLGGPAEVLNPWSPSETAGRQRWAEVLDPWLGCKARSEAPGSRPIGGWSELGVGDPIIQGEVLDPWAEAAYEERPVALSAPRPGISPRRLKSEER